MHLVRLEILRKVASIILLSLTQAKNNGELRKCYFFEKKIITGKILPFFFSPQRKIIDANRIFLLINFFPKVKKNIISDQNHYLGKI